MKSAEVLKSILKSHNGRLAASSSDRLLDIPRYAKRHNLAPKRLSILNVRRRLCLLIEAIKDGSTSGFKVLPPLIVHNDDGSYTKFQRFMDHKDLYVCGGVSRRFLLYRLYNGCEEACPLAFIIVVRSQVYRAPLAEVKSM